MNLRILRPTIQFLTMALLLAAASWLSAEERTYDGSSNNQTNTMWGAAGTTLVRLVPSAYGDGYGSPSGADRPSARDISNKVIAQSGSIPNSLNLSDWVFQWGQFIDHDMDLVGLADPSEEFDIAIPTGDPTFDSGSLGGQTMPFQRSQYQAGTGTPGHPREQVNAITSYLDASMVYGSDANRANALRTGVGGQLKTSAGNLLPLNTMGIDNADNGDPAHDQYYVAGDVRSNEQIGLTAAHTLFVREHNRQAAMLAAQHSISSADPWSDEQIYQQARKIVGAEIQSITFREFLPALLGADAPSVVSSYNAAVNPGITTEWATAFFRFGHTMLSPQLLRIQDDGTPAPGGPMTLQSAFFQQHNLSAPNQLDYIVKGLAVDTQQEIDAHVVDAVRNFLFGDPIPGVGLDLASLNIQRGRDHGLPDYNTMRVAFGLSAVSSFNQISSDPQVQAALRAAYGATAGQDNVNLVDPWVGAISEDHLPGTDVGPLIEKSLIQQFTAVRDGDRFWFDNGLNVAGLTPDEMTFVQNITLADIIEANTGIKNLQSDVFFAAVPEPSAIVLLGLAFACSMLPAFRQRFFVSA